MIRSVVQNISEFRAPAFVMTEGFEASLRKAVELAVRAVGKEKFAVAVCDRDSDQRKAA